MPPLALALILVAALVHVLPHAAIKGAAARDPFVWWMLAGNAVLYAPVLLWFGLPRTPMLWLLVAASGIAETLYLFAISRAYAGELSVAYPLARGSAPLFLLVFSIVVLHERLTAGGAAGIVLIAGGVYLINLPRFADWLAPLRSLRLASPRWAVTAGVMTAIYTSIDKVAVRSVHPLAYIYLVLVVTLIAWTPLVVFAHRATLVPTLTVAPLRVLVAAMAMPLAYALVLIAMRLGAPASYAGSVREVSVIVAALMGVAFFGERFTVPRIAGAAAIAAGIVVIAAIG